MRKPALCLVAASALLAACSPKKPAPATDNSTTAAAATSTSTSASTASSDDDTGNGSSASAATGPALPLRKAGQWELVIDGPRGQRTVKACIDQTVDKKMGVLGRGLGMGGGGGRGGDCSRTVTRTADGYTVDSVCKRDNPKGQITVTTHSVLTGDFNSAYKVASSTTMNPPRPNGPAERDATLSAKWLGDCPAGVEPGTMTLANGKSWNFKDGPPQGMFRDGGGGGGRHHRGGGWGGGEGHGAGSNQ